MLLVLACLCLLGGFGAQDAFAITYGPTVKGLGAEQTVFDWSTEACAVDEPLLDYPDQPARAFRDDRGRVQLQFGAYTPRRNIGSDLNAASSPGHHDCTITSESQQNPDPSKFDDFSWLSAPYTFDGHTVYSLVHEEFRGWRAPPPYTCTPPGGDTTKCWFNAITLETSTNSGDLFTHTTAPNHLVASVPYQWVNQTGPYGVFSPSNIIGKDGYLYVIVRAREPGQQQDISCVMRTPANPQELGDPTSWRAWGDGPDADSADSYEVQFVNPYTYNFTANDTPAKHMCKDVGGLSVSGVSETLTYNTYFGKYMLVGAFGSPNPAFPPGFWYALSDDLIHWSSPPKLLVALETQHSWQCGDPDPARDPSLLDPSSPSRNFDTTGRQLYVYYKIFRLNGGCTFGPDRDLLRVPIELQGGPANVPPTASVSTSSSSVQTSQAVSFDGTASTDPDGPITGITAYKWDLDGNGSFEVDTGTTPTTARSYLAPGSVTATLRVTDSSGATSDANRTVTVNGTTATGSPATSQKGPAATISCKTLRKKRAATRRRLRAARRKLARSHTSAAKQRYRKQIKSLRKRLKRLRKTPCHR